MMDVRTKTCLYSGNLGNLACEMRNKGPAFYLRGKQTIKVYYKKLKINQDFVMHYRIMMKSLPHPLIT